MEVQLGDKNILVEVQRKNNKNIYFRFKDNDILYVTCNRWVTINEIKRLIKKNEVSLLKMYEAYQEKSKKDEYFYYLGKKYDIKLQSDVKEVVNDGTSLIARDEKMLNKWLNGECQRVFTIRIQEMLKRFANIPKFNLRIRKMKTRWGVNNVTKCIITLNSELIKKDITLIDYVIVHELCHFYQANHSSKFWDEVGARYPDYKIARKRLRVE